MSIRKNRKRNRNLPESPDRTIPVIEGAEAEVREDTLTETTVDPVAGVSEQAAIPETDGSETPEEKRKADRRVRRIIRVLVAILLCLAVFLCANAAVSRHYQITFYQDVCRFLTGNIRIVFISDLHSRQYGEDNAGLLEDIASLSPDLILLGGDMINRNDTDYEPVLETCRKLAELAPVYGVLGNHECERIYYKGDQDLVSRFEETGVHMLRNESQIVKIGDNSVQLIGIEGTEDGFSRSGAGECMTQIKARRDMYRVVLTHIPALYREKLTPYSYDLGLAGHVHGGVVQIPRIGGLYSAEEGLLPAYSRGKYELQNGARLIVGGGMGDAGWMPRINNRPELLVIDVNWC